MKPIDKIVFGDNQFFGINHMSQDKARQQAEKFEHIDSIFEVYDHVVDAGIDAIMLNSNDRAGEICARFRANPDKYGHLKFYPSVPYPHKYANLVTEKGIFGAIKDVLFSDGKGSAFGKIKDGASAILLKDAVKLMEMLVDLEMESFKGLNVKVVFLQNIVVDLLLGLEQKDFLVAYCDYVKREYNASPGLITQNLPKLVNKLQEWDLTDIVICASVNKIGYLMSPSIEAYESFLNENDPSKYQIMAMSTLASGAINANHAYEYINTLSIQSIVFGASSKKNIDGTVALIKTPPIKELR